MTTESKRIFLAEDNTADVWLIEEALRRQSIPYLLEHYITAGEAIQALRTCGDGGKPIPDLLLLDYNLPGGRGVDILAAAAENPNLTLVPKAILSSFLRPPDIEEASAMGARCFISKPANLKDFMADVGLNVKQLLSLTTTP